MSTVNLGRLRLKWRGLWAGSTAYVKDDIVRYGVDSYICTTAHTSPGAFSTSDGWELMMQGTDLPSQAGHAGEVLKTDGTNLSWGLGGLVLNVATATTTGGTSVSGSISWNTNYNTVGSSHLTINYTPISATSTLLIYTSAVAALSGNSRGYAGIRHDGELVAWAGLNGYSADTGNAAMSAVVPSGSTNTRAIDFRNLGADGGFVVTLGRAQGDGSSNRLYPELSSMHIIEVEI